MNRHELACVSSKYLLAIGEVHPRPEQLMVFRYVTTFRLILVGQYSCFEFLFGIHTGRLILAKVTTEARVATTFVGDDIARAILPAKPIA